MLTESGTEVRRQVTTDAPATPAVELPPDSLAYRIKTKLLGPPLHTERLAHERLGKPTALAVFASDNLSSSAYATEEILRVLVPAVGVAAFSLVMPITIAMIVVLAFLILSYRQTIKAYPTAGGAYLVTRDNFGIVPAQVAGVALLTDYTLTVAVSVAAGSAALASAFSSLEDWVVPVAIGFIALIAYGNLRGVRESGKVFAAPTYFFMLNMALLLGYGLYRVYFDGDISEATHESGMLELGDKGDGLLMGASLFVVLHAFASGGAAVTGVEAISDGVPAFRKPEWRNARTTLVIMGSCLAVMFLGLSTLASQVHVVPFEEGTPTVLAQVGRLIYGDGGLGPALFYSLQAGTVLILIIAANTAYADFPRLASFQAGDSFLPRQLTIRGHRLVFSNGIIMLSAAAAVIVILTGARVERLIPLYAVGVFLGFTMSQSGMARRHVTRKEPGWRRGLFINGFGAVISAVVCAIIAVTKFTEGAWAILIVIPLMVIALLRLRRQYEEEATHLEHDVPAAATAPILKRHTVLVLIDRLDLAAARAIQYARTLTPDELRAVHFVVDPQRAERLALAWRNLGLSRVALELRDCPDRRLTREAVETVAEALADGETEVTVLMPERKYNGFWKRILHDRTGEEIAEAVSLLPHANVTTVPFHLLRHQERHPLGAIPGNGARSRRDGSKGAGSGPARPDAATSGPAGSDGGDGRLGDERDPAATPVAVDGLVPIAAVRPRQRMRVSGKVKAVRVQPLAGVPTLECTIVDDTGGLVVVFLGRREVAGMELGRQLVVEGMVGEHKGRPAMINPLYQIQPG